MKLVRWKDQEFVPASHEDKSAPGAIKKVLFTRELMQPGQPQMINWARIKVGNSFRAHYHEDMYEMFIIITGRVRIQMDGESAEMGPGDAVFVPERGVHEMSNIGDVDVDYLAIGIARGEHGKTVCV